MNKSSPPSNLPINYSKITYHHPMNLILIGPQGSGKGTQADLIVEKYHLKHIEAGELIRTQAQKHNQKSEIIDHLVNKKGQLLPDGIVLDMIIDRLENTGYHNLLFDGFPRTLTQYQALKELLQDHQSPLDLALYLDIPIEESVKRLLERGRGDDQPDIIHQRLEAFHQTTQPVVDQLQTDGLLARIDGNQPVETVFTAIQSALAALHTT